MEVGLTNEGKLPLINVQSDPHNARVQIFPCKHISTSMPHIFFRPA